MAPRTHTQLLIDNRDRAGEGATLHVVNPATEDTVAEFRGASVAQVDEAVRSARQAFEQSRWRHDAALRKATLLRFADLIEQQRDALMDALIEEIGTPVNLNSWAGVFAPAKTDPAIVERLNREINRILASPRARETIQKMGAAPMAMGTAEFRAFVSTEITRWGRLVEMAGIPKK